MKAPSLIKNTLYSWAVFFGTVILLSVGYAAWNTTMSPVISGDNLTASWWNALVDNITDLNDRVSGVTSSLSALQVSAGNLWTANGGNISYTGGNVGIGTTTPGALVHVYKESGNNAEIDIQSVAGANKHWGIYQDRTSESLKFWNSTAGGDIVTFTKDGKVGIGVASPMSKFVVQAPMLSLVAGSKQEFARIGNSRWGTASDAIRFTNIRDSVWSNIGDWNTETFRIERNIDSVHESAGIDFKGSSALAFRTNNTEQMVIDQNGYIGIGTSSPSTKFQIYSSTAHSELRLQTAVADWAHVPAISFKNPSTEWSIWLTDATGLSFRENSASYTSRLFIANGGNVGIGTIAPSAKLEVVGNIIASNPVNGNHVATKDYVDTKVASAAWGSPTCIAQFLQANTFTNICPTGYAMILGSRWNGNTISENYLDSSFAITAPAPSTSATSGNFSIFNPLVYKGVSMSLGAFSPSLNNYNTAVSLWGISKNWSAAIISGGSSLPWSMAVCCK